MFVFHFGKPWYLAQQPSWRAHLIDVGRSENCMDACARRATLDSRLHALFCRQYCALGVLCFSSNIRSRILRRFSLDIVVVLNAACPVVCGPVSACFSAAPPTDCFTYGTDDRENLKRAKAVSC